MINIETENIFPGKEVEAKFLIEQFDSSDGLLKLLENIFICVGCQVEKSETLPLKRKTSLRGNNRLKVRVTSTLKGVQHVSTKGVCRVHGLYVFERDEEKNVGPIDTTELEVFEDIVQWRYKLRLKTRELRSYCFALARNYKFEENMGWQSDGHVLKGDPKVGAEIEYKGSPVGVSADQVISEMSLLSQAFVHMVNDSGIYITHKQAHE